MQKLRCESESLSATIAASRAFPTGLEPAEETREVAIVFI